MLFYAIYAILIGPGYAICKKWWKLKGRDEALLFCMLAIWTITLTKLYDLSPHIANLTNDEIRALGYSTIISLALSAILLVSYGIWSFRLTFHAEVVGKKRFYLGDAVHFKAWYKGELKNGLFTSKVELPNGRQEWWPAYDTFQRTQNGDLGVLSGRGVHEAEWSGPILKDYPTGPYTAHIKVCDRTDLDSDDVTVKEKPVSFLVLPPGYGSGSTGTSTILTSSPEPIPRERRRELEETAWKDVRWFLPSTKQLRLWFDGKFEMKDSDTNCKLRYRQHDSYLELEGEMAALNRETPYTVYIGKCLPDRHYRAGPDTIIRDSSMGDLGPWTQFKTKEDGSQSWSKKVSIYELDKIAHEKELIDPGQQLNCIIVWINDDRAGPGPSVLESDLITIQWKAPV